MCALWTIYCYDKLMTLLREGGGGVILEQKPHLSIIHSETDFFFFCTEVTFNGDSHVRIFGWLKVPSMKSI